MESLLFRNQSSPPASLIRLVAIHLHPNRQRSLCSFMPSGAMRQLWVEYSARIDKNIRAYHAMLERLHDAGITHADLHSDNVLYDYRSGKFNPIDFCHIYTERHLQTMSRMWDATVNNGQATTFRFEVDREHAQTIGRSIDHWNSAYLAPPLRCKLFWNTRL